MAKIPLPERGQPLDLSYIYQIVNAVNDLSSLVVSTSGGYLTVDTPTGSKQNVKASEARTIGGYVELNNVTLSTSNEVDFSYEFSSDFKYAPIATATPVVLNNTTGSRSATVIIKNVTTSRIDGVVRFDTGAFSQGTASIGINIIVIGIPV